MPRTDEERMRAAKRAAPIIDPFVNAIRTAINSYGVDRSGVTAVENPNRPAVVPAPITGFMNPTKYGVVETAPVSTAPIIQPATIAVPAKEESPRIAEKVIKRESVAKVPVQVTGPEQLSGPVARKPIAERFGTLREALRGMDDDEYKMFVDSNKHIPGIGYVENKEGRIERIIPSSSQSREEQSDLTPEQLHAMTGLLNVQHQARAAAASEARLGIEGRRADLGDRRADLTEQRYADMTKLEREKLAHDIAKTDFKDPVQRLKTFRELAIAGGGKRYILDENQMRVGEENVPDWEGAAAAFKAVGFEPPYMPPKPKPGTMTAPPRKGEKKQSPSGKTAVYDGTKWVFEK